MVGSNRYIRRVPARRHVRVVEQVVTLGDRSSAMAIRPKTGFPPCHTIFKRKEHDRQSAEDATRRQMKKLEARRPPAPAPRRAVVRAATRRFGGAARCCSRQPECDAAAAPPADSDPRHPNAGPRCHLLTTSRPSALPIRDAKIDLSHGDVTFTIARSLLRCQIIAPIKFRHFQVDRRYVISLDSRS